MFNKLKYVVPAPVAVFATSTANAAVDVTAVVAEIDTYPAIIASVGAGVLIVALAVKGIKWARSAL